MWASRGSGRAGARQGTGACGPPPAPDHRMRGPRDQGSSHRSRPGRARGGGRQQPQPFTIAPSARPYPVASVDAEHPREVRPPHWLTVVDPVPAGPARIALTGHQDRPVRAGPYGTRGMGTDPQHPRAGGRGPQDMAAGRGYTIPGTTPRDRHPGHGGAGALNEPVIGQQGPRQYHAVRRVGHLQAIPGPIRGQHPLLLAGRRRAPATHDRVGTVAGDPPGASGTFREMRDGPAPDLPS